MSTERFPELKCCECDENFEEASKLLAHFALHVVQVERRNFFLKNGDSPNREHSNGVSLKNLPDLYPIRTKSKTTIERNGKIEKSSNSSDQNDLDPLNFCHVSIEDGKSDLKKPSVRKRYRCEICEKSFGWSTDLKRHLLIHSGLRPFKCDCGATFTRNFLLKNHINKKHNNSTSTNKTNLPKLKPIFRDIVKGEMLVQ